MLDLCYDYDSPPIKRFPEALIKLITWNWQTAITT